MGGKDFLNRLYFLPPELNVILNLFPMTKGGILRGPNEATYGTGGANLLFLSRGKGRRLRLSGTLSFLPLPPVLGDFSGFAQLLTTLKIPFWTVKVANRAGEIILSILPERIDAGEAEFMPALDGHWVLEVLLTYGTVGLCLEVSLPCIKLPGTCARLHRGCGRRHVTSGRPASLQLETRKLWSSLRSEDQLAFGSLPC